MLRNTIIHWGAGRNYQRLIEWALKWRPSSTETEMFGRPSFVHGTLEDDVSRGSFVRETKPWTLERNFRMGQLWTRQVVKTQRHGRGSSTSITSSTSLFFLSQVTNFTLLSHLHLIDTNLFAQNAFLFVIMSLYLFYNSGTPLMFFS